MKIAIMTKIYSKDKGGAERYAVNLANALLKEGHEVHIFANRWDIPGPPVHSGKGIIFHHVPMGIGPRFLKLLSFHWRCQRQLKAEQFDIVHSLAQTYPADIYRMSDGLFLHWMSLRYPNPMIRFLHLLSRPVLIFNLVFEKRIIGSGVCRMLIANSDLCRQQAETYYGVSKDRIAVIYNGVDLNIFNPGVKIFRSEIRKAYKIGDKSPLLLFSAMNFSRKGLGELVRSLPLVRSSFPGIRLLVIGKGDPKPYQRIARLLGIEDLLVFAGPVKDPTPFYGAADLFVLPTHYDPFANVCLEAMACGLPVVTTRQNGASELIEEGVNGYSIEKAEQIADLAETITMSLSNHSRMGGKAAETAISYSQANHVQRVLEIYRSIASEKISVESLSSSPFVVINSAFLPLFRKNRLLFYDQIMSYSKGITLKRIKSRTITKLTLTDNGEREYLFYMKRHRSSRTLSLIIKMSSSFLFFWKNGTEGYKEWGNIVAFHRAGLPTMVPVAAGGKKSLLSEESFLVTSDLEGYESLERWVPSFLAALEEKDRFKVKRELIRKVALLTRRMHYAGFYHRDLYLTHLLLKEVPGGFDLKIIDLQRVLRYPWFKRRWKIKDLASLNYSSPKGIFTRGDRLLYFKYYQGVSDLGEADRHLLKIIQKKTGRIDKHTVRMYQKRGKRRRLGLLER